jgi:hypothetical protein
MTNRTLAQATAVAPASVNDGFSSREGILFDSDVCTAEDERMEAIKNNILKKLRARLNSTAGVRD